MSKAENRVYPDLEFVDAKLGEASADWLGGTLDTAMHRIVNSPEVPQLGIWRGKSFQQRKNYGKLIPGKLMKEEESEDDVLRAVLGILVDQGSLPFEELHERAFLDEASRINRFSKLRGMMKVLRLAKISSGLIAVATLGSGWEEVATPVAMYGMLLGAERFMPTEEELLLSGWYGYWGVFGVLLKDDKPHLPYNTKDFSRSDWYSFLNKTQYVLGQKGLTERQVLMSLEAYRANGLAWLLGRGGTMGIMGKTYRELGSLIRGNRYSDEKPSLQRYSKIGAYLKEILEFANCGVEEFYERSEMLDRIWEGDVNTMRGEIRATVGEMILAR